VSEIAEDERSEFLAWYESKKSEEPIFDNRRVFEK